VELVRSLGADDVIDYTREDVTDGARRYDLVLDTAGNRPLAQLRRAVTAKGTLVIVGGEGGGRWTGGFGRQIVRAPLLSLVIGQTLRPVTSVVRRADLLTLSEFLEDGRVTPVIGRTVPLAETAELLDESGEGHRRGKSVVMVA
jgi:NADPH:quinone reductase-like Zn-dependent oxidoreductase